MNKGEIELGMIKFREWFYWNRAASFDQDIYALIRQELYKLFR